MSQQYMITTSSQWQTMMMYTKSLCACAVVAANNFMSLLSASNTFPARMLQVQRVCCATRSETRLCFTAQQCQSARKQKVGVK